MEQDKISFLQMSVLFMLSVGLMNHVIVIPMLLTHAKRDAWISVLLTGGLFLAWLILLRYIMKRTQYSHLFLWIRHHCGKTLAWGTALITYLFLVLQIGITLKDMILWTVTSYFPQSPPFILSLLFLTICYFAATSNLTTISYLSGFLIFFVILLGFFVGSVNFLYKDFSKLLPIMENGWLPVTKGMIYSAGGLLEVTLLLFLQHQVNRGIKIWNLVILGIILIGLTLGPLLGSITIFGPQEAAHQRYPAYEEWRLLKIGKYIEHIDFFSIYQWLSGAFIRISLGLYICGQLLPFSNDKRRHLFIGVTTFIIMIGMMLPISDIDLLRFLQHIYFPVSLILFLTLSIVMSILAAGKGG